MNRWPTLEKKKSHRKTERLKRYVEFEVASKARLNKYTKEKLVDEVYRLQTTVRNVAVELGLVHRTKNSELTIDFFFVSDIIGLIKEEMIQSSKNVKG